MRERRPRTKAIGARRVLGTRIKDLSGATLGTIEDLILDKTSCSVLFAVVGVGGVFGVAKRYHPVPWSSLRYRTDDQAYVVCQAGANMAGAPSATLAQMTEDDGELHRARAYDHYGIPRSR
jgi:uncharacterized protein YrrD